MLPLVVEPRDLADRLPDESEAGGNGIEARSDAETEAHGALLALGYKPTEAVRMLKDLDTARLGAEGLIREALKRVHER